MRDGKVPSCISMVGPFTTNARLHIANVTIFDSRKHRKHLLYTTARNLFFVPFYVTSEEIRSAEKRFGSSLSVPNKAEAILKTISTSTDELQTRLAILLSNVFHY